MSLLSKLTSLFQSNTTTQVPQSPKNPKLELVLYQIMKPSLKYDIKHSSGVLLEFLSQKEELIDQLFQYLSEPTSIQQKSLLPISFIQLLVSFHYLYLSSEIQYEIALKLKESKIYWLSHIEHEKKKNFEIEIDANEIRTLSQADYQKNNNLDSQIQRSNIENKDDRYQSMDLSSFSKSYYVYLQRLGANVDLYVAISLGNYPYQKNDELIEPKLMFLWHYKIQNIINTGLGLLLTFDLAIASIQKLVWIDLLMFQSFLSEEIAKIAECYATLPNSDTLSLYEIYCDAIKHYEIMKQFQVNAKILSCINNYFQYQILVQEPAYPQLSSGLLSDFLSFSFKLKMLNQITFKKSIKVPNKQNPCLGIPRYHPHVFYHFCQFSKKTLHHLRAMSGMMIKKNQQFECEQNENFDQHQIQKVQQEDNSEDEYNDEVDPMQSPKQNGIKVLHLRGLSTYQNK